MKNIIAAAALLSLALGCSRSPAAPGSLAGGSQQSAAITFDGSPIDSPVNGSEAQLAGFDGVSLLSYNTTKGSFTAEFNNDTVVRAASLNQFTPTDPCRQYAGDYNAAGAAGNASGLFGAISSMSTSGCLARIRTDRIVPPNPTAPIRSFRPLAAF